MKRDIDYGIYYATKAVSFSGLESPLGVKILGIWILENCTEKASRKWWITWNVEVLKTFIGI